MKSRSEDLLLLLAVVDSGGFSAAAELLDTSVTKVSRAVTRLENSLQTTLLNRTTRQVNLTEEGFAFVEQARAGLALLEQAEESLQLSQAVPSGKLRIDAANPFILHQIIPHVAEFARQYPQIELELSASDQIVDLLERRIDVAIRIGALADSSLHARPLGQSPLSIVASADYLNQNPACQSADDIRHHRVIGFTAPDSLNTWHLRGFDNGYSSQPDIRASSGEVVRQLCLAGNGLAYLSRFMIADDLRRGDLMEVLADQIMHPNPRERVSAVYYRNSVLSSRIEAFLDFYADKWRL